MRYGKKTASDNEIDVNLLINGAEEIELPKDSIDTVVMTYTLCTIPNPMDALKEIKRVMKMTQKCFFVNMELRQIKTLLNGKIE